MSLCPWDFYKEVSRSRSIEVTFGLDLLFVGLYLHQH